jgi:hypothetical protein
MTTVDKVAHYTSRHWVALDVGSATSRTHNKCKTLRFLFILEPAKDNINILGGSLYTIKENTESLEMQGDWINADKTKYMVMSRDQNAGGSHRIKTDNSSFERVEQFKYL